MFKIFTILSLIFFSVLKIHAQVTSGFLSVVEIAPLPVTKDTGEMPQSKVWTHDESYWAVLPETEGTYLWRLEETLWVKKLKLSDTYYKADCKVDGNLVHILLFRGRDVIYLATLEYDSSQKSYKTWSRRKQHVELNIGKEAFTATIDLDEEGRMWLASDTESSIEVRWSDTPYDNWSAPITLADQVTNDDICAIVALPGKIGIMWTNQKSKRFGFKIHKTGTHPSEWSEDEVPSSQSALDLKGGMASASLNLVSASNGTLYAAVKTRYDTPGQPRLALLVRQPAGSWDNLYEVSLSGERPAVILNEDVGKIRVIYNTSRANGNNIVFKESSMNDISFTEEQILLKGPYTDVSSFKDKYKTGVVVLASNATHTAGALAYDAFPPEKCCDWHIFPNPFATVATLSFTVPEGGAYSLLLYDMKGQTLITKKQGHAQAGETNNVEVDGKNLSRGMYFLQIQTQERTRTLKLVIDK